AFCPDRKAPSPRRRRQPRAPRRKELPESNVARKFLASLPPFGRTSNGWECNELLCRAAPATPIRVGTARVCASHTAIFGNLSNRDGGARRRRVSRASAR